MDDRIKILIVEDDPVITEFLQTGLRYEGYHTTVSNTGSKGLDLIRGNDIDLVILDIMLPDMDGFNVCRRMRTSGFQGSILMLTVKKDVRDRIAGLDSGADDYLIKPFHFDELLARLRALLRRSGRITGNNPLRAGNIVLNIDNREVFAFGTLIDLTPTEFSLLELFMRHPHRVFTRETLLNRVLGYNYDGGTNIIDVHISHLRKKLKDKSGKVIKSIYGVGYSFHPEET